MARVARRGGRAVLRARVGEGADAPTHVSVADACGLSSEARSFLEAMARASALSGRAIVGSARVARTIADIDESATVTAEHVAEALGFRNRVEGVS